MGATQVGIREFRNNLKDYLEQVERGESIEITKNGRTIGMLVPRHRDDEAVDRLIAQGKLLPSESGHYSVRLPRRVQLPPGSPTASEILDELRGSS
jgi:prevent-host-death family protein